MSLGASLPQKVSAIMDCLSQITLARKLSRKFKMWCQFLSCVKDKSFWRLACISQKQAFMLLVVPWGP